MSRSRSASTADQSKLAPTPREQQPTWRRYSSLPGAAQCPDAADATRAVTLPPTPLPTHRCARRADQPAPPTLRLTLPRPPRSAVLPHTPLVRARARRAGAPALPPRRAVAPGTLGPPRLVGRRGRP